MMTSQKTNSSSVQLGFSEPLLEDSLRHTIAHNSPLWKEWDGGKIGGKPSWLNPRDLPTEIPLRCKCCFGQEDECGEILRFVAQLYCPADSETGNKYAFHRSLYVFVCPNSRCSNRNDSVVVLRGQLSRLNPFYPPDYDDIYEVDTWNKHISSSWKINTCFLCGQYAQKRCPKSEKWFCGRDHQLAYHRSFKKSIKKKHNESFTFLESEIVVEEEPPDDENSVSPHQCEQNCLFDNNKVNASSCSDGKNGEDEDELIEQKDLNEIRGLDALGGGTSDPMTMEFYTRIGRANGDVKSQCLRYCRWPPELSDDEEDKPSPLWISSHDKPRSIDEIPPCEYCGSKRNYEFQLMPQMIHCLIDEATKSAQNDNQLQTKNSALTDLSGYIENSKHEGKDLSESAYKESEEMLEIEKTNLFKQIDSIDWGVISIYTCSASCGNGEIVSNESSFGAYRKEFGWRQGPIG